MSKRLCALALVLGCGQLAWGHSAVVDHLCKTVSGFSVSSVDWEDVSDTVKEVNLPSGGAIITWSIRARTIRWRFGPH